MALEWLASVVDLQHDFLTSRIVCKNREKIFTLQGDKLKTLIMKLFSVKLFPFLRQRTETVRSCAPLDERIIKELDRKVDLWVREQRYLEDIRSNDDFARSLGVDRLTICRYFLLIRKEDPRTWRTRIRIEKAEKLIEQNPELPISVISDAVGFSDRSNFSRQFRKYYGLSPQGWRNLKLEERHEDIYEAEVERP